MNSVTPRNSRSRRKSYLQPVIYSLLLLGGIITGIFINPQHKTRFYQILDIVKLDYVEKPEPVELEEFAIKGMLSQLDPHSTFIPKELVDYTQRQVKGNLFTIGADFILYADTPVVISVPNQSSAFVSGLKEGDRLLSVNSKNLTNQKYEYAKVAALLSGKQNTFLTLKVLRKKNQRVFETQVKLVKQELKGVDVFYMLDRYTGLIKINYFGANTHNDFKLALQKLSEKGAKNIVIDLRNNGGGLLRESIKIANEFLNKGDLISYTKGRKRKTEKFISNGNGIFKKGRVLILTNTNTASASEILSGALQDNDRALVIGTRTFGKGLVQEPYLLPDGSFLRLTVAKYYTPSGRSIQKPYTKNIEEYKLEIYNRNKIQIAEDLEKKEYFSLIKNRKLHSGGGIWPDMNLSDSLNTKKIINSAYPNIFANKLFQIYILDFCKNEVLLINKKYNNPVSFNKNYQISNSLFLSFKKFVKTQRSSAFFKQNSEVETDKLLQQYLKAYLAQQCFSEAGYSLVINTQEGVFTKIQLGLFLYDKHLK